MGYFVCRAKMSISKPALCGVKYFHMIQRCVFNLLSLSDSVPFSPEYIKIREAARRMSGALRSIVLS